MPTHLNSAKQPRGLAVEAAVVESEGVGLAASGQPLIQGPRLGPLMPLLLIED